MSRTRTGNQARRQLEFDAVVRRVKRDRERFIAHLQKHLRSEGACVLWTGCKQASGYGRTTLRLDGKRVTVDVHRLFLILRLGRPIAPGHEAGHEDGCPSRSCVRHVVEQHWADNVGQANARTASRRPGLDVPF